LVNTITTSSKQFSKEKLEQLIEKISQ